MNNREKHRIAEALLKPFPAALFYGVIFILLAALIASSNPSGGLAIFSVWLLQVGFFFIFLTWIKDDKVWRGLWAFISTMFFGSFVYLGLAFSTLWGLFFAGSSFCLLVTYLLLSLNVRHTHWIDLAIERKRGDKELKGE